MIICIQIIFKINSQISSYLKILWKLKHIWNSNLVIVEHVPFGQRAPSLELVPRELFDLTTNSKCLCVNVCVTVSSMVVECIYGLLKALNTIC